MCHWIITWVHKIIRFFVHTDHFLCTQMLFLRQLPWAHMPIKKKKNIIELKGLHILAPLNINKRNRDISHRFVKWHFEASSLTFYHHHVAQLHIIKHKNGCRLHKLMAFLVKIRIWGTKIGLLQLFVQLSYSVPHCILINVINAFNKFKTCHALYVLSMITKFHSFPEP